MFRLRDLDDETAVCSKSWRRATNSGLDLDVNASRQWRCAQATASAVAVLSVIAGAVLAYQFYPGTIWVYLVYSLVFALALGSAFLGAWSWPYFYLVGILFLAFPVKLGLHLVTGTRFVEPTGLFRYSPEEFNTVLWIASLGGLATILAKVVFHWWMRQKDRNRSSSEFLGVRSEAHFVRLSCVLVIAVVVLATANLYWGFFHMGLAARTVLPFKLTSVVFWAHNFGTVFALCYLLNVRDDNQRTIDLGVYLAVFCAALLSISTLSRGVFLFVALPLILALVAKYFSHLSYGKILRYFVVFGTAFAVVLVVVSYLRSVKYTPLLRSPKNRSAAVSADSSDWNAFEGYLRQTKTLVVDRWIGLEGLAAIVAYPKKGPDIFAAAIVDDPRESTKSIYNVIAGSPFVGMEAEERRQVYFGSQPGFMAFLLLSGSVWLVFGGSLGFVLLIMYLGELIERVGGNNIFLSSVMGCALAVLLMRFSHPRMHLVYLVELGATLVLYRFVLTRRVKTLQQARS